MVGLVGELLLQDLALGDIADVQDHSLHARQVKEVGDGHLARRPGAQLVTDPTVQRGGQGGCLQRIIQAGGQRRPIVRMYQVQQRLVDELTRRVGEDPFHRGALEPDDAISVGQG